MKPDKIYQDWSIQVPPPKCYFVQDKFYAKEKLLMIPGPTNLHPNVLRSLSTPILSHTDSQFYELLHQIQNGIRYLFQTNNTYTFALTGSATIAMETSICNILKPGQRFLSLVHGYWGKRIASMGHRLGFITNTISVQSIGENFSLIEIENALRKYQPNLLYVCHGESSLGSVQCLDGIGHLCHQYDCLLIVDAVVSLCSTPLFMDQLEIDVLFSGVQKSLSGPPGLALISFSDRAVCAIKERSQVCPALSFYMDIELIAKAWDVNNDGIHTYHYTPAINLLFGLRASIREIIREGLENVVQRHQQTKIHLEKRLNEIGLEFLIKKPENRLAGITSVIIPCHIDGNKVIQFMYEKNDILIGGSLLSADKTIPKYWRIGYLGVNAEKKKIDILIESLKEALKQQEILKAHL